MYSSKNIILLKFFNLGVIIIIFYFSIIEISNIPIENKNLPSDKILHLGAYLILGLSTVLAKWEFLSPKKLDKFKINEEIEIYFFVIFICFIYGIIIEIIQNFVPSRNFDFLDILANGIGIFIGIFIHFFFQNLLRLKKRSS